MNILFFSRRGGPGRVLHVGRRSLALFSVAVLALPALTAWLVIRTQPANVVTDASLREALQQKQSELAAVKKQAEDETTALTLRLGQLQAQIVRLNALGQRLVEDAGLDRKEFDFSQRPPQGGPERPVDESESLPFDLSLELDQLADDISDREQKFAVLEALYMNRRLDAQVAPRGRPIRKGWISSYFGMRTDPFTGKKERHKGLDLAGKMGSEVLAVADGVVTWSGKRYGYGNMVEVNHGKGYVTRYAHNSENLVKPGEVVHRGQQLARMGSSGRSTGPHVHFEVLRKGQQINPAPFVRAK